MSRPLVVTVLMGLLVLFASISTASARPPSNVGQDEFFVVCQPTHSAAVDPILYPGVAVMSHQHQFFGNSSTNENSTGESLRAAGPSACRETDDRSGYWIPQPYLNGEPLTPDHVSVYYSNWPGTSPAVAPLKADTQLIAGKSTATAPLPTWQVRWSCGNVPGRTAPASTVPYNCDNGPKGDFGPDKGFDGLVGSVFFPACWNGNPVMRTQGASPSLVYYSARTGACPTTHPKKVVRLSVRVHFGVFNVVSGGTVNLTFAGMDMNADGSMTMRSDRPYYTFHADFMNGWIQTRLVSLVKTCLNAAGDQHCSSVR